MATIVISDRIDTRHKHYAKHVTSVDVTKTNGFALLGEFLREGREQEVPAGAIVLRVYGEGSAKHRVIIADVLSVNDDGTVNKLASYDYEREFVSLKNKLAELTTVNLTPKAQTAPSALAGLDTEALIAEVERRGYLVMPKN